MTKHILTLAMIGALALPLYGRDDDPAPTPTPNPTASPSPTPGDDHGGGGGGGGGDDHGGDDHPDLSLHGLYEGTTSAGGIAVFYIERNTHIQINLLDISGQSIGFAEGQLTNGPLTFTLCNRHGISGT